MNTVEELTLLQRRLIYELSEEPETAGVLFPEHPLAITLGRTGSRSQVRFGEVDLISRQLPIRYVPRGGGAMLHTAGQATCYPLFNLAELGLTPGEFVRILRSVTARVVSDFVEAVETTGEELAVRVKGRRIAHLGIAVRNGWSLFGVTINVHPDLEPFPRVRVDGDDQPMTSLYRESTARVTVDDVQKRWLEGMAEAFSCVSAEIPTGREAPLVRLFPYARPRRN